MHHDEQVFLQMHERTLIEINQFNCLAREMIYANIIILGLYYIVALLSYKHSTHT